MEAKAMIVKTIIGLNCLYYICLKLNWLNPEASAPTAETTPNPIPLALEGSNSVTYKKRIEK
jgi:hypothetical protein